MKDSEMRLTYRPVSPETDWELFKQHPLCPDIVPLTDSVLKNVFPLDETACSVFWKTVVTPNPDYVWYRQLPQDHWAHQLIRRGPNWYDSFEKWPRPDPVAAFLQSQLNWESDLRVFFVRSNRYVIQTLWSVFRDHWRRFLFSDDDPFLLAVKQPAFLLLGDTGVLAIGERPIPLALDI